MLEQSSTGRTYTRDAYAPVRRDAQAEVEKLTAGSIPARFHFSNFEKSVLDRNDYPQNESSFGLGGRQSLERFTSRFKPRLGKSG